MGNCFISRRGGSSNSGTIEPINIVSNGTYIAPEGILGYNPVVVNATSPISFLGDITLDGTNYPILNLQNLTVDYASATSSNRGLKARQVLYNQYNSWELCASFTNYSYTSAPAFAVFGSCNNSYFHNPSLEINSGTGIWAGSTTSNGTWTTNMSCTTSESFNSSKSYVIKYGWNGSQLYIKVYNITDNTLIGSSVVSKTSNPHTISSASYPLCFCNNSTGSTSRFKFYGKLLLKDTYVKANDSIIWGQQTYITPT